MLLVVILTFAHLGNNYQLLKSRILSCPKEAQGTQRDLMVTLRQPTGAHRTAKRNPSELQRETQGVQHHGTITGSYSDATCQQRLEIMIITCQIVLTAQAAIAAATKTAYGTLIHKYIQYNAP